MNYTFLTGKEIAVMLKISKALAYRLISTGEITSIRFGRTVRVREEDLKNFIASKTSVSLPQSDHTSLTEPGEIQ
jgi:excisionase family DNA binding protein